MDDNHNVLNAQRIAPSKLAHVVFRTGAIGPMRNFYLTLLNGSVAFENEHACFIKFDEEHHRIGLIHDSAGLVDLPTSKSALHHISFTYPTLQALLASFRLNRQDGLLSYWAINHGPTMSIYYHDPDGNTVETQYDVFSSEAELDDYFASGQHEENFLGVIFDPDEVIDRLESGVPVSELVRRPRLPDGLTPFDMLCE